MSDVTSFYMRPYNVLGVITDKSWLGKTPARYLKDLRKIEKRIGNWISGMMLILIVLCIGFVLPLIVEGTSIATIALAGIGVLLMIAGIIIKRKYQKFFPAKKFLSKALHGLH